MIWSLSGVCLEESVVSLGRVLNVGNKLLDKSRASSGLGFLSIGSSFLLKSFLSLSLHLLLVLSSLFFLSGNLVLLSALLSNLLDVELMLSLELVGELARDQKRSEEDHCEDEAPNWVPSEQWWVHNAQGQDAPPVESVEEPEETEDENDLCDVAPWVLVDGLVVRCVDWVVSGSEASNDRGLALLSCSVDSVLLHSWFKRNLLNKLLLGITNTSI